MRAELIDRVEQILRHAEDIDTDFTSVLQRASAGQMADTSGGHDQATNLAAWADTGGGQGMLSIVSPPGDGSSPTDNAGWWASLSEQEKKQMLADHAGTLGNRDGLPAKVRDDANRARFDGEYSRLKQREAQLQQELDSNTFGGLFSNADAGLEQVQAKLHSMDAIRETMARPDRHLLNLNMSNERAEAAVAVGNVDTATHVANFTPGMTTTVDGDLGDYDRDMDNMRQRTMDQLDLAGKSDESVATVSWIGYQAPQWGETLGDNSVLNNDAAQQGGEKLADFNNGIDASRGLDPATGTDSNPHLTALSHSYGTPTTGVALQQGTGVDDTVFYGSPGLETRDVQNLNVPDGHSYNIEARNDPIADAGQFGPDPGLMDGMQQLSAHEEMGPDGKMSESAWHSYYLQDNSTSQYNQAAVIAGLPGNTIHDH